MKKLILTYFILMCLFFSCWERQEHDITRSLIPVYKFNGTAIDIDTAQPIPKTKIKLVEVNMLYEVDFGEQIVTADSTGFFQFDSVYPGDYLLSYDRNGQFIGQNRFTQEHSDTSAVIEVPQIMIASPFDHHRSNSPAMACSGNKTWVNIFWWGSRISNNSPPFIDSDMIMLYEFTNNHWFEANKSISPLYPRFLSSMTFIGTGLLVAMNTDTLYQINNIDMTKAGTYPLDHIAKGVALHIGQSCVYTCFGSSVYKHNPDNISQTDAVYSSNMNNLTALAYYRNLYAFDNDRSLLQKFDNDMNVETHYALIKPTGSQVMKVHDISFDGYAKLWFTE